MAMNPMTGIPVIGGMFDDTDEQALAELRKNQDLYSGIDLPTFENYTPEELKLQGEYNPENAFYDTMKEDPRIKSAQMAALERMSGLSETGLSAEDDAGFTRARNQASQIQRSGTQAAMQNAQARGVGGSGLEFAMREMANQSGAQAAQEAGLAQAAQASRQRADYLGKYEAGLSNVRGQDANTSQYNTGVINAFNQANTQNRNQAQQYNLGNKQDLANTNVTNRNNAVQYRNQMAQQQFGNNVTKVGGQAGANTGMAQGWAAQNAANTSERNANAQLGMDAAAMSMGMPPSGGKKKAAT